MLTGHVNINAKMRNIQCEMVVTYTTICISNQMEIDAYIVFEFKLVTLFQ